MQALETYYNGYRFRSRLEARWAVFFDAMGWKYQYEPQGFLLPDDIPYLPDFFLPELQVWVEIKPTEPSQQERMRAYDFSIEHLTYFIFYGVPGSHGCFWVDETQEWCFEHAYFARCCRCASGVYVLDDSIGRTLFSPCAPQCDKEAYDYPEFTDDILRAFALAKGARFEHGEHPPTIGRCMIALACAHCGACDIPQLTPGNDGPHVLQATCRHCGRFIKTVPRALVRPQTGREPVLRRGEKRL